MPPLFYAKLLHKVIKLCIIKMVLYFGWVCPLKGELLMKKVAVYTNAGKDRDLSVTSRVISYLSGSVETVAFMDLAKFEESCRGADALIVLGGDGTLLRCARLACGINLPLMGVNLGKVGYLAEVDVDSIEDSLDKLLKGDFAIEERFMIKAEVIRDGKTIAEHKALNDMVISGASFKKLVSTEVYVGEDFVGAYNADGVVVATPTGSTAYSLSAGGPIVDSTMELMIITPICPHALSARPLVIPKDKQITAVVSDNRGRTSVLTADGQTGEKLAPGDKVIISPYCDKTRLIRLNGMSFYETLRRKISN